MTNYRDVYVKLYKGKLSELKDTTSEFVFNKYQDFSDILENNKKLKKEGKEELNITLNIQYALALDMLIKFYLLPYTIHKSKDILSQELNIPGQIMQSLLDKFTNLHHADGKAKLVRTKDLILKSFYYTVILAFALFDYEIDADPLCRAMKIDKKEMHTKLRVLNCVFPSIKKEVVEEDGKKTKKKNITEFIARLKAPLSFNIENTSKKPNKK